MTVIPNLSQTQLHSNLICFLCFLCIYNINCFRVAIVVSTN